MDYISIARASFLCIILFKLLTNPKSMLFSLALCYESKKIKTSIRRSRAKVRAALILGFSYSSIFKTILNEKYLRNIIFDK